MAMAGALGTRLQVPHPQQDLSVDFEGLSIPHNQAPLALGLAWERTWIRGPPLAFGLEMTNPQARHHHLMALAATECELYSAGTRRRGERGITEGFLEAAARESV